MSNEAISISIDQNSMKNCVNAIRMYGEIGDKVLAKVVYSTGLHIEKEAKQNAPHVWGDLKRGISATYNSNLTESVVVSKMAYSSVVEYGRKPKSKAPPTSAIAKYLRKVGGDEKYAWITAKRIGENGIKERPFMAPALKSGVTYMHSKLKQELNKLKT